MRIRTLYAVTGYLSIITGVAATICISRINWMLYAIMLSITGFILSGINIFLNAKYFSDRERFSKGYLGMFLSSLPVVFLMLIIFKFRK